MLATEAEAKTKWCPEARVQIFGDAAPESASNRIWSPAKPQGLTLPHAAMCLGSDCMWWEWASEPLRYGIAGDPPDDAPPLGYCGASRRP